MILEYHQEMAKRGPYSKGTERREEILSAAFDVLSREGIASTSLSGIGRAIGLESAHLVYYFPSREALLIEVLRRWDARNDAANVHAPDDVSDAPFGWWVGAIRRNQSNRGVVQVYTALAVEAADPSHPAHEYFAERYARVQDALAREIETLQEDARFDPGVDPAATATTLVSLSDGLQLRWLVDPSFDMASAFEAAISEYSTRRRSRPAAD